mmetsp:Transcript_8172/g.17492  ORF Transcript_8172/g.17492 Transcript_8172/m.17492 type:complete len:81 (-) Transcript_8172:54-296(-)
MGCVPSRVDGYTFGVRDGWEINIQNIHYLKLRSTTHRPFAHIVHPRMMIAKWRAMAKELTGPSFEIYVHSLLLIEALFAP